MPFMNTTGVKALGLAALVATGTAAYSEEGVLSWSKGTSWKGSETPFKIKLGAKVEANAFYHDQDDEYNRDQIFRNWSGTTSPLTTADLDGDGTAGTLADQAVRASQLYYGVENSFADGIQLDDAELWLKGSAYGNIVFGIKFEGAKGDTNVELDNWYMGIAGIPGVGTVTIGEHDISWGIGEGAFWDDTLAYNAWGDPDTIGLHASNEFLDGKLGYSFVFGIEGTNESGGSDRNYEGGVQIWGSVYEEEDTSVLLMVDAYYRNPSSSAHNFTNETFSAELGLSNGPTLVTLNAAAENVTAVKFSGSLVSGAFMIGASFGWYDLEAPDEDTLGIALNQNFNSFINGNNVTLNYNVYQDGTFTDWQINAAYSLTGETQGHGGGIKPKANFAWDGSGSGAFEVVARISGADWEDDVRKSASFALNPAGPSTSDIINGLLLDFRNADEGGEVLEMEAGINWYLNPSMKMGLYIQRVNWSYDADAANSTSDNAQSAALALDSSDLPNFIRFVNQSSIENDYDVTSLIWQGTVKF